MPLSESADAISRFVAIPDVSVYTVRTNIGQLPDPPQRLQIPWNVPSHIRKSSRQKP